MGGDEGARGGDTMAPDPHCSTVPGRRMLGLDPTARPDRGSDEMSDEMLDVETAPDRPAGKPVAAPAMA